jgi:hypothetical protein
VYSVAFGSGSSEASSRAGNHFSRTGSISTVADNTNYGRRSGVFSYRPAYVESFCGQKQQFVLVLFSYPTVCLCCFTFMHAYIYGFMPCTSAVSFVIRSQHLGDICIYTCYNPSGYLYGLMYTNSYIPVHYGSMGIMQCFASITAFASFMILLFRLKYLIHTFIWHARAHL